MTEPLLLTGIDGSDPLGFFAALGVLRVLSHHADDPYAPRLGWVSKGDWQPSVSGVRSIDEVVEAILNDLDSWSDEPALFLAYGRNGEAVDASEPAALRDLKPPLELQRTFFDRAAARASKGRDRTAQMMAAFGTDVAVDRSKGNTKPTAFHFTAGKQLFLKTADELRANVRAEDVREALVGPWTYASRLKSLSWTGLGQRQYALRARNPSGEPRTSCAGAEWLAFVGLSFFPCVPIGRAVHTTCVAGGWKDSVMTWPLWIPPASARTVASLLRTPDLKTLSAAHRSARGIAIVLQAGIRRAEPGGYGSFTPAVEL